MGTFNINLVKQFCAGVIESEKLTLPVRIEVMDTGMTTFYEMTAVSKDDEGTYLFSKERIVGEGGAQRSPWRVRYIGAGAGEQPFVKTCPG
jgi:hypothetical protein